MCTLVLQPMYHSLSVNSCAPTDVSFIDCELLCSNRCIIHWVWTLVLQPMYHSLIVRFSCRPFRIYRSVSCIWRHLIFTFEIVFLVHFSLGIVFFRTFFTGDCFVSTFFTGDCFFVYQICYVVFVLTSLIGIFPHSLVCEMTSLILLQLQPILVFAT